MRLRRKPPPEWEWPSDLRPYADLSGRLAVLMRRLRNTEPARNEGEVRVPKWLFMAQDDLPAYARYISIPHADRGETNFYLKGRVILLDRP